MDWTPRINMKVVYIGKDQDYPKEARNIIGLKVKACCGSVLIDTGCSIPSYLNQTLMKCVKCGKNFVANGVRWKDQSVFRPLDDIAESAEQMM